eukprot:3755550-Prymnesium_polylepis.1
MVQATHKSALADPKVRVRPWTRAISSVAHECSRWRVGRLYRPKLRATLGRTHSQTPRANKTMHAHTAHTQH